MNHSLKKSKILILSNLNKNNDHRVYKSYFFFKKFFHKVDDKFYKYRKFQINFITKVVGLLKFIFLIRKLNKKNSYDYIYMHDLQCLILIFFLNNKKKTKYIWDAHELYEFTEYNQRNILFKFIIFLIIKFSHKKLFKIITVSNSISNVYEERYLIEKKKLFVIENIPLKSEKLQKEKKNIKLLKKKKIIYIGAINNQRFTIEFLNNLDKIPNDWALYFVSPINSFFLKYKEKYKNKKNLIFLELKQVNNQINFIKKFDIGLIPSNSNCLNYLYSLPNKFWTYYLSGIPILSFNGKELKKRILSEKIGYILYRNNLNNMINVLSKLNFSLLNKIKNKQKKKLLLFNSSSYLKKKYLKIFNEQKKF